MPTTAGLRRRQEASAARLCSPPSESLRNVIQGQAPIADRLRRSVGLDEKAGGAEITAPSNGRTFPGGIHLPPDIRGGDSERW